MRVGKNFKNIRTPVWGILQ